MTFEQIVGLVVALVLMFVGLLGTVIPAIPGAPLIFAVAVLHKFYFGAHGASLLVLTLLGGLMILALALDFLGSTLGAKKFGGTWKGIAGAAVGGIVGLFFAPIGLFAGPFLGAVAGEMMGGRKVEESAKAGAGALLGLMIGMAGKLACCCAMIGLFALSAILNGGG
jgi:uncharacterized protein YqgC (DUF456 family)